MIVTILQILALVAGVFATATGLVALKKAKETHLENKKAIVLILSTLAVFCFTIIDAYLIYHIDSPDLITIFWSVQQLLLLTSVGFLHRFISKDALSIHSREKLLTKVEKVLDDLTTISDK